MIVTLPLSDKTCRLRLTDAFSDVSVVNLQGMQMVFRLHANLGVLYPENFMLSKVFI